MIFETDKMFIESYFEIKSKESERLLYRNVADDILFQKHFTDFDYLDRFSRYERFCEPWYS